jgi:Flp pilus assembly secretin CpaC
MTSRTNETPTVTDIWLRRIKNNPIIAAFIVLGMVVIAANTLWHSLPEPAQHYLTSAPNKIRTWSSKSEKYKLDASGPTGDHFLLPDEGIAIQPGSSRVIDFPKRIRMVTIADTVVADLEVVNPYEINLIGHKPGTTTLTVWNADNVYTEQQVHLQRLITSWSVVIEPSRCERRETLPQCR